MQEDFQGEPLLTLRGLPEAASQPFATFSSAKSISWISFITLAAQIRAVLNYVKKNGVRMHNDGFRAVSDIRAGWSSHDTFPIKHIVMFVFKVYRPCTYFYI